MPNKPKKTWCVRFVLTSSTGEDGGTSTRGPPARSFRLIRLIWFLTLPYSLPISPAFSSIRAFPIFWCCLGDHLRAGVFEKSLRGISLEESRLR